MSQLALKLIEENKKTRATFLDLGNCGLTKIPYQLAELEWLEELSFADDWYDDDRRHQSKNSGKYNNISELSGGFRQFKKPNSVFYHLKNLKKLWLNGNEKLSNITPLASLVNLQTLVIFDTQINDVNALANLVNLQTLYIYNTQINDVNALASLVNLQTLVIFDTQINDVSALASLVNLQTLDISYTQINDVSALASLVNLQRLYIFDTQINDVSALASLVNLQRLYINNTQVSDLSPLLAHIKRGLAVKLKGDYEGGIIVENCPLTNPPISIIKQGNGAILNYFKEKEIQGVDYLYEAKLLLVGEGGAGKTSLLRRLYQPEKPLPQKNESTKGIMIYRHAFKHNNGGDFYLNVWDFGGQEIYHATHQFFLTQRSLYILLDDTRKDDKTIHDANFKYWLEVIELLSNNSPVLLFQNEKSGRSKEIDFAGIQHKFNNVKERHQGDLSYTDSADKIFAAIEYFAQQLPHIGEELPAQWINIRAEIETLAKQYQTITFNEYLRLYENYLPANREQALYLSRYLHDLGIFLHFQDDDLLKRTVILQNEWATEAVFKILDDERVKKQLGRFNQSDCERIWHDSIYADMHLELLALMQKFELCYLLADSQPKQWLAPQLLPPSKPVELTNWEKVGDLVLRYNYEFLPKGMINRLMVRQHRFVTNPQLAWLTGVLFERNNSQVLVEIADKGNEIILRARGIEAKELLSIIANDLDALNETFKGLSEKVKQLIPCCCPECKTKSDTARFERNKLLKKLEQGKRKTYCPDSDEKVDIKELLDGVFKKEKTMKKIFISYSKSDVEYKNSLIEHCSSLKRQGKIQIWSDNNISAGDEWDKTIKKALQEADIVLYLISSKSLATDYIQDIEIPIAKQRSDAGECKLVPVIIKPCDWTNEECAKYNALPRKGTPITKCDNEDEAWLEVIKGIERLIK